MLYIYAFGRFAEASFIAVWLVALELNGSLTDLSIAVLYIFINSRVGALNCYFEYSNIEKIMHEIKRKIIITSGSKFHGKTLR